MPNNIKKILVPVDFSAPSRAALWRAGELAAALDASVEMLHVIDAPGSSHIISEGHVPVPAAYREALRREADEHLKSWLETASARLPIHRVLGEGRPHAEIVKFARDNGIDLIVMGTHGRGAMATLLLGSVADKVIRTAPCPVMTVRVDDATA